jgi:hypothetical protein
MRDVSEDFKAELGRANYVTPTSYLELITMFQRLVTAKRIENSKTLSRYTVGLDKLQSSAQQVAGMQQELRVRNPISLVPITIQNVAFLVTAEAGSHVCVLCCELYSSFYKLCLLFM